MLQKNLKLPLIILCGLALLVILAPAVQAQSFLPACVAEGYCTLCDMLQLVINFGKFLLGLVGSLALLMFVYGGFVWLTSGGESGKIDQGKKILVNSVIGIGITFFAWVVVSFVVTVLTASTGWSWNIDLTCAKLPGLPDVALENRDVAGSAGKKEGEACTQTSECLATLYCTKTDKKCTVKIATGGSAEDAQYVCKDKEIAGNDDVACQSGSCAEFYTIGCPTGQCCKSDKVGGGEQCDANKKCQGPLYCKTDQPGSNTGTCQNKLDNKGKVCRSSDVVGDSKDICASGNCESSYCVPSSIPGTKSEVGDSCTDQLQCSTLGAGLGGFGARMFGTMFCYKWGGPNPSNNVGICSYELNDGQRCDSASINTRLGIDVYVNAPCKEGLSCCTKDGLTCGSIKGEVASVVYQMFCIYN